MQQTTGTRTAAQLVAEAKQHIEDLTPADVVSELGKSAALMVDIREPGERAESGAIPNSVHAPRWMLEFYADPTSPYHRPEFDPARRTILLRLGRSVGPGQPVTWTARLQQCGPPRRWIQGVGRRRQSGGSIATLRTRWAGARDF